MSVSTADKGDVVLVVWSDPHNNYTIYHEVSQLSTLLLALHPERSSMLLPFLGAKLFVILSVVLVCLMEVWSLI